MSEYEDLELGVPDVQYGEEVDPPGTPSGEDTPSIEPDIERDQKTDPFTDESDDMTRINAAPQVAKIELNPRLTGGYDSDRIVGDEGIAVVIEPQSADGTYVPLPGEVTVEAYESGSSLSSNRIGRWDFSAFETADLIQESLFGKGVHLQLPWPGEAPRSDKVRIVVKFVDPSGQRFTAKRDVPIDAPEQNVASHPESFPISKKRFATAIPQWKATR